MLSCVSVCLLVAGLQGADKDTFEWTLRPQIGFTADLYVRFACRVHDQGKKHEWKAVQRTIANGKLKEISPTGNVIFIRHLKKEGVGTPEDGEPSLADPIPADDPADHEPESVFSKSALPILRQSQLESVSDYPLSRFGFYAGALGCVPAPQHAVKTGEVWDSSFQDPLEETAKLRYRSVVVGRRQMHGIDVLEINQSVDVPRLPGLIEALGSSKPEDKLFFRAEGTFFLDPKTGMVVQGDYKLERYLMPSTLVGMMLASAGESILVMGSVEFHEERIFPGQNDVE